MKKQFTLNQLRATQQAVKSAKNEVSTNLKLMSLVRCCEDYYPFTTVNVPRTFSLS